MVMRGADTNCWALLKPAAIFPELRAAAVAKGISVEGVDSFEATNELSPGDAVTMLIDLHQKHGAESQWLICFEAVAPTNGVSAKKEEPTVLYTSSGNRFEFGSLPVPLRVRTVGPVKVPDSSWWKPQLTDAAAVVSVNEDFLELGLDKATMALRRLYDFRNAMKGKVDFSFGISSRRYGTNTVSRGRNIAEQMHMTKGEERSLTGGVPVMFSYFNTIQQTPELDSIMFKVISLPSVWSVVGNMGVTADIGIGRPRDRVGPIALPGWEELSHAPLYTMPVEVSLDKHPALKLTLIVTDPHPPFLLCGGIVGFLAENPKEKDNYLTLRVISAHDGETKR